MRQEAPGDRERLSSFVSTRLRYGLFWSLLCPRGSSQRLRSCQTGFPPGVAWKPLGSGSVRKGSANGMFWPLCVIVAAHWYKLELKSLVSHCLPGSAARSGNVHNNQVPDAVHKRISSTAGYRHEDSLRKFCSSELKGRPLLFGAYKGLDDSESLRAWPLHDGRATQ